ncbi:hypothetical protein LX36DRAFT_750673 [Colletotrichum falcatum]|nr:hypothetical protein LX36DRAFT_750673 [Colletotrichum falcatum]
MTRRHRNLALHHLAVLAVLSTTVLPGARAIEDLDPEDVPPECALACAPVAQLTERCEAAAEQQFGAAAVGRRWAAEGRWRANAVDGGPDKEPRRRRRERGARRSLQRMLGTRLARRLGEDGGAEDSEDSEDSDSDSDDSGDEEEEEKEEAEVEGQVEEGEEEEEEEEDKLPASGNVAETGGDEAAAAAEANEEAAVAAMRACVCGEGGFDVAAAAFGCAACIARNATAADADEVRFRRGVLDIRGIMAECGFIAATDPPPPPTLAVTTATPPPLPPQTVLPTAATTLPPLLAPAASGTETQSPLSSPASPTPTQKQTPTPPSQVPPADASGTATTPGPEADEPVTPVTVFVFSTLPPLVRPNDVPSAPPVLEQNGNRLSGAAKGPGTALGGWLGPGGAVLAVVVGLLL